MCSVISPVTPIAWPSPTIAWWLSRMTRLLSSGKIMPTEIRREPCCSVRNSSCAASCSTSCLAALSAFALSGSSPLAAVPDSCRSVGTYSPTFPPRTHPQPSLLPPLSPLVSAAQNVPLPCLSSKDSLSFLLGNSRPGARTLTLPNHPTIPLSTARAFAPTAVVSVLPEIHLNPPLTFVNYPYPIASSDLPTLFRHLSPVRATQPCDEQIANRACKIHSCTASAAPAASPKSPYRKWPRRGTLVDSRGCTAPAHLR